jgi:hypothetical protein
MAMPVVSRHCVGQMSVGQMSVGQMSVGQMSVGKYLFAECFLVKGLLALWFLARRHINA